MEQNKALLCPACQDETAEEFHKCPLEAEDFVCRCCPSCWADCYHSISTVDHD